MISIDVNALADALAERLKLDERSPWMSTAETAEYLRVSEKTVRRWIGDGLPHRKVEGRLLFNRRELDEYVNESR